MDIKIYTKKQIEEMTKQIIDKKLTFVFQELDKIRNKIYSLEELIKVEGIKKVKKTKLKK